MKELRLLNEEETKEIAKKLWENEKMQKYLIDTYDFYTTKDGLILELEKVKKISIDKTMYYDDEYEAPDVCENNFINYNKHNIPGRNLEEYLQEKKKLDENGCATGRYDYNGIYLIETRFDKDFMVGCSWLDDKDKRYFKRYLTIQEQNDYQELMEERKNQYIERLKKYWKRYSKHVSTHGYWANR